MSARRELGVCVVGRGRAGQARERALADHPRARRVTTVPGASATEFAEALTDDEIEAVIVCTPNTLHPGQVGAALLANRHVAVEFPLAPSAGEARELFSEAERSGCVLHVEHIELLSPGQHHQRGRAAELGRPTGGTLHFRGGLEGWIGDPELAGSEALRAVARLHRLVDVFGPASVAGARIERERPAGFDRDTAYRLEVDLRFAAGGSTTLVEERRPSVGRGLHWNVICEQGLLDDPPTGAPAGLFRQDLDVFVSRIEGTGGSYVSDARVLEVLELVGVIESALSAP